MTDLERLRFYLRDPAGASQFFVDEQLQELLDATDSFEEATGLGWLIRGSGAAINVTTAGAITSKTLGKASVTYSSAGGSSAQTAFAMSNYWFGRSGTSVGRWWSIEPDGTFVGELMSKIHALELSEYYDLSRLIP